MGIPFFVSSLSGLRRRWSGHCHFKRNYDLDLTGRSRLQADCAHMCIRIVEVAACEAPPTLCNRRAKCLSPGQPHVGRAVSLVDRRIAKFLLDPLCQNLSKHMHGGRIFALTAVCGGAISAGARSGTIVALWTPVPTS